MAQRKEPPTSAPDAVIEGPTDVAPIDVGMADQVVEVSPPESTQAPQNVAADPSRGSGILGPLVGGALAAVAGFGLSHFNLLGLTAPDQTAALAALEGQLAETKAASDAHRAALQALEGKVAPLVARLAALEAVPSPEPPDLSRLDGLEERLAAIEAMPATGEASTAALAAKLADIERRLAAQPQGVDQAEVDAALARLAEAEAQATARAEEAAAAAASAAEAAAFDALESALQSGAGFQAELSAVSDPALVAALTPHVAGVATLEDLQAEFPDLARQVLVQAREGAESEGWGSRLVDFLAAQTGARSLTPRDGDDPDAILSRAEFALGEGRVSDALTEVGLLDPALRAPLDPWIARAEARLAALAALEGR